MRLPLLPSASARTQRRWLPFGWVAGQIETSRRREVLSWSHHSEVAALEPKEQDHLLDLAVAIAKALEPEERGAAKERKVHDGRAGKLPSRARTRDKVAANTGMSGRTLEKATATAC